MNKKKISIGPKLYITLCFIFFYLPIAVTMFFSFNSSKSLTKFTGFSLKWYKKLLTDNDIIAAVYVSISIAVIATIISTVLGTITAIGLSRSRKILMPSIVVIKAEIDNLRLRFQHLHHREWGRAAAGNVAMLLPLVRVHGDVREHINGRFEHIKASVRAGMMKAVARIA